MGIALLKRDTHLALKKLHHVLFMGAFLLFCGLLLPFALGPEAETLARFGPGIIWVLVIFTLSLSVDFFYQGDDQDGSLENLILHCQSPTTVFAVKAGIHSSLLTLLIAPICACLCLTFQVSLEVCLWLVGSLLIAIPGLVFVGGVVATLSLNARLPILVKPLLLFPLTIPLLIFGIGVTEAILIHQSPVAFFKILCAVSLLTILSSIWIGGKGLY